MEKNCWEIKKCGREPDGTRAEALGVCPASVETKLDGVHNGKNAGRTCWVVAGTLCRGEALGTFYQKYHKCEECDFYHYVKKEEGENFSLVVPLLLKLKEKEYVRF